MRLDQLTTTLRPRHAYEAADLGAQLVQHNLKTIYTLWLIVLIPIIIVALSVDAALDWHLGAVIVWWFKPLLDYVVLWALSQLIFGQKPKVSELSHALPLFIKKGLIRSLSLRRFNSRRAYQLPVWLLEDVAPQQRQQRLNVLNKNINNRPLWLQRVFWWSEQLIFFGLIALIALFDTDTTNSYSWRSFLTATSDSQQVLSTLLYASAMSLLEPFYVAAGFAMYLNRRSELEGWDLEIGLRQLSTRLQEKHS